MLANSLGITADKVPKGITLCGIAGNRGVLSHEYKESFSTDLDIQEKTFNLGWEPNIIQISGQTYNHYDYAWSHTSVDFISEDVMNKLIGLNSEYLENRGDGSLYSNWEMTGNGFRVKVNTSQSGHHVYLTYVRFARVDV